jgi:hypothetical protein
MKFYGICADGMEQQREEGKEYKAEGKSFFRIGEIQILRNCPDPSFQN